MLGTILAVILAAAGLYAIFTWPWQVTLILFLVGGLIAFVASLIWGK